MEKKEFFYVRQINENDFPAIEACAFASHAGMTSLPKEKHKIFEKFRFSLASFEKKVFLPDNEFYFFVLENFKTKQAGGISGISARLGASQPTFFYKIEEEHLTEPLPHQPPTQKLLKPVVLINGPTELCSLFLLKDYRKKGLGTLLALSRYLFIALNRKRFGKTLIAELRGFLEDDGTSLFWEYVGKKFFNLPFDTVERMRSVDDSITGKILPKYPIYISLLEETIQHTLGKAHHNAIPALHLLLQQNFSFTFQIDPYDAGPIMSAQMDQVPAISSIRKVEIASFKDTSLGIPCLIAKTPPFRCVQELALVTPDDRIHLPLFLQPILDVKIGDEVHIFPLSKKEGGTWEKN